MFHNETVHDLVSGTAAAGGGRRPGPGPAGSALAVGGTVWLPHGECSSAPQQRPQSRSMSRYFFLRMETWSLKRTGSSLICEWISGI